MDMSQYRELFITESREHVRRIGECIVALEGGTNDRELLDTLFRSAHSLKGMSSSMGYGQITELSHRMEDFMILFRKQGMEFGRRAADLMLAGADLIELLIEDVEQDRRGSRPVTPLMIQFDEYDTVSGPEEIGAEIVPPGMPPLVPGGDRDESRKDLPQTVRVKTGVLDRFINITGELLTIKHRLLTVGEEVGNSSLNDSLRDFSRMLRELHDEVMLARMQPFSAISNRFPRMIRDLARDQWKEVLFEVVGSDIEVDRGILEQLVDPLNHILRNAVDHGLENGQERRDRGKPSQGKLILSIRREKDHVEVAVTDDGRGMDPQKLIERAVAHKLIGEADAVLLSPRDAFMLTCIPGFSTADTVTRISGRGVGMDVVRSTVQSLGGTLSIDSKPGEGSTVALRLPLTIAIINVLLVAIGDQMAAFPINNIVRTVETRATTIHAVEDQWYLRVDDEEIPLFDLQSVLGLAGSPRERSIVPVVVSEVRGRRIGLRVDRLLGQQEVFVKPVGRPLGRLRGLAGGTILGDGKVVFIYDIATIL